MGYWTSLVDVHTKEEVKVPLHQEGSIYNVDGSDIAHINITSNYYEYFYKHIDKKEGLSWLNGKTGIEAAPILARAVCELGQKPDVDYWKATAGNAGRALNTLLKWACLHPKAIFEVEK